MMLQHAGPPLARHFPVPARRGSCFIVKWFLKTYEFITLIDCEMNSFLIESAQLKEVRHSFCLDCCGGGQPGAFLLTDC
jgi:hypothetical protein